MVPRELVLALFSAFETDSMRTDVLVGRVPAWVPAEALHPGARTLGALVVGPMTMVMQRAAEDHAAVDSAAVGRLLASGWRLPPAPLENDFALGRGERPQHFCNADGDNLMLVAGPLPGGGSDIRAFFSRGGDGPCGPGGEIVRIADEVDFPVLEGPPGSTFHGRSSTGGGGGAETTISLETQATPAELVDHYARQLGQAGWILGQRAPGDAVASQAVETRNAKGEAVSGFVSAFAFPGALRQVSIRVIRVERDDVR
ncbi:MAG TPA: hypothetical protein VNP72_05530 [Longimicrobium sp.]|nr:hypothetical protein [Longimicrobium sp.]